MSQISFPQAGASLHKPPQVVHRPGSRDAFANEPPSWGPIKAGAALRTWSQWLFIAADTRDDAIGAFARRARSDGSFPSDATRVIRYLVTNLAPAEVIDAALASVAEFRKWQAEGLELALRDVGWTNQARADSIRESLRRSQAALDLLYAEDARLAHVGEADDTGQDQKRGKSGGRRGRRSR